MLRLAMRENMSGLGLLANKHDLTAPEVLVGRLQPARVVVRVTRQVHVQHALLVARAVLQKQ